ncbi:MAG: hypothetical protein M5U32_03800 [Myxococcota bacterium]|nr:hypothetical protein [Myxococcota bacterium]
MGALQRVAVEPEFARALERQVLDEQVGAGEQALQRGAAVLAREIQRDAALVRVEEHEQPALLGIRRVARERAPGARDVAVRILDLHHVGAEVGEQTRAVGGRDAFAEFDHADAVECLCHGRGSLPCGVAARGAGRRKSV